MKEVLLVEDNPADVYLIQRAVADCGSDIHLSVLPDGVEALAFLRKEAPFAQVATPALILLDLNLPKVSGQEVLTALRRLPAFHATPVVVFSSADKGATEALCLYLGATAYVQKPLSFDAFCEAIAAIVNRWLLPSRAH